MVERLSLRNIERESVGGNYVGTLQWPQWIRTSPEDVEAVQWVTVAAAVTTHDDDD